LVNDQDVEHATARNRLLTIIVGRFWSGPF